MWETNYRPAGGRDWQGRVDSTTNFDAFRWHQHMEFLDLRQEQLPAFTGVLGFAILGFCSDLGVARNKGRAGAAQGPEFIRQELANLPCTFDSGVKLYDAGDILCQEITLEEGQALLAEAVAKLWALNLFPLVLGGGHEVALGHYRGLRSGLEKKGRQGKLGIINFDAHFDIRPYNKVGSSGTMFRQIYDQCRDEGFPYGYMCLGIQRHGNTVELFKTAKAMGVEYLLAKEMLHSDKLDVVNKIDDFIAKYDHIYVTICADVFSAAYAPGVSASQPLGLDPELVLFLLEFILKSRKLISFDIAEVSPRFDLDDTTSSLAAVLLFALVNTKAHLNGLGVEW